MENTIKGQENLMRAYEICLAGNYVLSIVSFDNENGVNENQLCEYAETLRENEISVNVNSSNGDILIELTKPTFESLMTKRKQETFEDIKKRVFSAKAKSSKPLEAINEASQALLKMAYNRLNLQPFEVEIILRVSATIAWMDGSEYIKTEHIAEASQYRSIDKQSLLSENIKTQKL